MVFGFCMMNWVLPLWKYLFSSFFNPFTIGQFWSAVVGVNFWNADLVSTLSPFYFASSIPLWSLFKEGIKFCQISCEKNPVKFAFDCRRSQKTVYSWWLMCQILGSLKTRPACIFCVSYRCAQQTSDNLSKTKNQEKLIFEN